MEVLCRFPSGVSAMDLRSLRAFIFDLDGCVYNGNTLLTGVDALLETLRRRGRHVLFLTNNSREGVDELLGKFRRLGLAAAPEAIVSAADVTGAFVRERYGPSRVLAVGSERLMQLLAAAGHAVLSPEEYRQAQVVVMGHDATFDYAKLTALSRAVRAGAPFVAVNLDPRLPVEAGEFFPGCGGIVEAVAATAGIRPVVVGKPRPHLFEVALSRLGFAPQDVAMVGDSPISDIQGAQGVGLRTIWIAPPDAAAEDIHPDLTIHAYAELLRAL
jgi:HAD superfamily hydrolase (TIGR01450 family)